MNKFFVIRKDGTLASAGASLGGALDYMGNGRMLYMGTSAEAVSVMKKLGGPVPAQLEAVAVSEAVVNGQEV